MLLLYIDEWEEESDDTRIGLDVAVSRDEHVFMLAWQAYDGEVRVVNCI